MRWLDERHKRFQATLDEKGAKILETNKDLRTFLWIVDEKNAIFSFNNYGKGNREVSFRTNDKKLIESLLVIANETLKNSSLKTEFGIHDKTD